MADKNKEGGHDGPEPEKADQRQRKVVEQDPKDIPHQDQSQTPDLNPGKAQPGHRDREEVDAS